MNRRKFLDSLGVGSLAVLGRPRLAIPGGEREGIQKHGISRGRDPRAEISIENLLWNFARVKKQAKTPVMAVVKANAYGHGLVETASAFEKAGAEALMVGKFREAFDLREAGIRIPILNFGPFSPEDAAEILARRISQAVFADDAAILDERAAKRKTRASVHIDIDTGMGRTGVPYDKALPLIEKIGTRSSTRIDGICTTLTEDPEFDREQIRRFLAVCAAAKSKGIDVGHRHAASSAGLLEAPEFALDMVRPGITLYGYYPNARTAKEDALGLKPTLKLTASIIFIKDLEPGESISYLRAFKASEKMRVATLAIGYSDGYPAQMGGQARVSINGKSFPVLPAVTANHTMINLFNDPAIRVGDEAVLIAPIKGSGLTAADLAAKAGISDYKLLIGLNPFLPRSFL
jgi:alanine racemase